MHQRPAFENGGIVEKEFRWKTIGAIEDDVVSRSEFPNVRAVHTLDMRLHLRRGSQCLKVTRGAFCLLRAHIFFAMKDLAVEVGDLHSVIVIKRQVPGARGHQRWKQIGRQTSAPHDEKTGLL